MSGNRDVPFYLSISGNIGVGKSTVCHMVGEALGWPTYYEPVDNNPYIADYYKDMPRWAFHLQIYFLSKRFEVQKEIIDLGCSAVQDRTIYEDVDIFAKVLNKRGAMDDRDYENYREVFRNMVSFLRPPDLVLFLRAGVHDAYEEWIGTADEICPVRIIDTERVNLRDDPEAQREFLDYVGELHGKKRKALAHGGGA